MLVAEDEGDGAALAQSDGDGFGRAETAAGGVGLVLWDWEDGRSCLGCGDREGLHAEGIRPVRVFKRRASDAMVADEGADAGEGDVEAIGLGELRGEKAELDFACCSGIGSDVDGEDGGGGRVRLQIEVEKAEPEAAIVAGEGGADGARMRVAAVERKRDR